LRRPGAAALAVGLSLSAACARTDRPLAPPEPAAVFGARIPEHADVVLATDAGPVRCRIDPARVPRAAALFVGLARGQADFRDARTGARVRRPYYDGLPFFRRIPHVLVQSGCPVGDGSGHPGYRIPVEPTAADAALLAQPGVLLLAHYQPPPGRADPAPPAPGQVIGSQFAIALAPMAQNLGAVTVLGRCTDLDVVARLAQSPKTSPPPTLRSVRAW